MGLDRVLGQKSAVSYLKKLLETKSIPSTLLFVGPKGVGKFFTAKNFAKALNCTVEPLNGCDNCKSCITIENNTNPNVKIIDSPTIGIDQIRDVINSSYVPINGYKVNIFKDVENATIQAFNSMLKFLEEPPKKTLNILIAESEDFLPETIVSRSSIVRFNKLRKDVVKKIVFEKTSNEELANTLSYLLDGSLENLETLIQDENIKKRKNMLISFLMLIKKKETTTALLTKFKDYYGELNEDTIKNFFDETIDILRDIVYVVVKKETELIKNIDLLGFIADEFVTYNMKKLKSIYNLILQAKENLLTNANPIHIILSVLFSIEYL